MSVAAPEFINHLDRCRAVLHAAAQTRPTDGGASDYDAELLELYRGVIELQKMHNAFVEE